MMTFLQFACTRLLGPAEYHGCDFGDSYWHCPFHENDTKPSFHTMPHKPKWPDKFKCWGCDTWGDAKDLLQHFYPGESPQRIRARLKELRQDYERENGNSEYYFTSVEPVANNENAKTALNALLKMSENAPSKFVRLELMKVISQSMRIASEHRTNPKALAEWIDRYIKQQEIKNRLEQVKKEYMNATDDELDDLGYAVAHWTEQLMKTGPALNGR